MRQPKPIRELMSTDLAALECEASCCDAAHLMRERDIGTVLVTDAEGELKGIVTDRDLVVRCMADRMDPAQVAVGSLCTAEITTLPADANLQRAIDAMRRNAIRRIPIVEGRKPVGIVSLSDLARDRDPESQSILGAISAAPPTH